MAFEFSGTGRGFGTGGFQFAQTGKDDGPDVEYTGELREDIAAELDALQAGFKSRAQAERKRFKQATDSEFWFAVCFESRELKEKFLAQIGVKPMVMGDKYLDGRQVAQVLGVSLE